MGVEDGKEATSLIFCYGTLKHGFHNHTLMQDLIRTNDAVYLGVHRTLQSYPLVCGPYGVPFLLNFPGSGDRILGELYAVSAGLGLDRLDELEGISTNHYERLPVEIVPVEEVDGKVIKAEAYYGHRSFAEEMWKKNGEKGFCVYSEQEAKCYVKRIDRPGFGLQRHMKSETQLKAHKRGEKKVKITELEFLYLSVHLKTQSQRPKLKEAEEDKSGPRKSTNDQKSQTLGNIPPVVYTSKWYTLP